MEIYEKVEEFNELFEQNNLPHGSYLTEIGIGAWRSFTMASRNWQLPSKRQRASRNSASIK